MLDEVKLGKAIVESEGAVSNDATSILLTAPKRPCLAVDRKSGTKV